MKAKTCKHEGCSNPVWSQGMCQWHKPKKPLKSNSAPLKKTPIKRISDKRKKQEAAYSVLRKKYLEDNPRCEICGSPASQIHHKWHRENERLNDTKYWMSVDDKCHKMIHRNPEDSYRLGYLIKG